jgi:hypothetical protein
MCPATVMDTPHRDNLSMLDAEKVRKFFLSVTINAPFSNPYFFWGRKRLFVFTMLSLWGIGECSMFRAISTWYIGQCRYVRPQYYRWINEPSLRPTWIYPYLQAVFHSSRLHLDRHNLGFCTTRRKIENCISKNGLPLQFEPFPLRPTRVDNRSDCKTSFMLSNLRQH